MNKRLRQKVSFALGGFLAFMVAILLVCMIAEGRTQKPKGIKINPQRLPVPRLSPTRPVRIDTKETYYALTRKENQ